MRKLTGSILLLVLLQAAPAALAALPPHAATAPSANAWTAPAQWRHRVGSTSGTLRVGPGGATFTPRNGAPLHWNWNDIETADLFPRQIKWVAYTHRGWHIPGRRVWRFRLEQPVPPSVAAKVAGWIGRPVRNGVPDAAAPAWLVMPAHHDGVAGQLRLRAGGIDFVSAAKQQSRSWRWGDIETLAHPDADHLLVTGGRDTWSIALSRPLPAGAWNRLWDAFYGRGLQLGLGPLGRSQ